MKNSYILFLITLLLSFTAMAQEPSIKTDQISVVGTGEVEAEPDQVILRVSVNAQKPDLPSAKSLADERYSKVLAVLKSHDIQDKHIKATHISAQPQYEWRSSQRVYRGERVSRSISVTVLDLDKLSPLMQALVENEVSTIDGIEAGFQDRDALLEQALAAAADNAKSKAKFLANRLGRDLGKAFLISEYNQQTSPIEYDAPQMARAKGMMADAMDAPPEMLGMQTIRAEVSVSFNLL